MWGGGTHTDRKRRGELARGCRNGEEERRFSGSGQGKCKRVEWICTTCSPVILPRDIVDCFLCLKD